MVCMARQRKTRDEWHIEVNYGYGHGWEHETTESSWKEAREMLKCYRANVAYPVRSRKRRVRIEPQA